MIQQEKTIVKQTQKSLRDYVKQTLNFRVGLAFLFGVSFAMMPILASAAELNLISQTQEIAIGQQFQVDVILNTEGEEINAIEGKIVFPDELLEVKEIRDGNSIVNFWIERPLVLRQTDAKPERKTDADIVFSGIVPGGYNGSQGLIFSVILQAKKEGRGRVEIQEAKTLLNDGKGTEAKLKIFNFQFSIFKEAAAVQPLAPEIRDLEPPETFMPEIASDPTIFDGKYFLVFATQDKGSGIDYYALRETRRKIERETDAKWVIAESPYLLKDQKLRSYIYVKAVDKVGNERVVVVEPRYPLKWYEKWENWIIIVLLATLIFYILRKVLWQK